MQVAPAGAGAPAWLLALASVVGVSLLSLVGAVTFVVRREQLHRALPYLVSVAVGAVLGTAFLHLIPEVAPAGLSTRTSLLILAGMVLFFVFERFIHWHQHGHADGHARVAPYAWLSLTGDGLHNFADGIIIGAAYLQSPSLGFATTVAVAVHEIPQELGDVGILLLARLSRAKALMLNVATGFVAVLGTAVALVLGPRIAGFTDVVIAVTAGGFIYVAAADLIPELHRERRAAASALQLGCLLGGIALMLLLD